MKLKTFTHCAGIAAVYLWTIAAIVHHHPAVYILIPLCVAAIITMPHPGNWKGSNNA